MKIINFAFVETCFPRASHEFFVLCPKSRLDVQSVQAKVYTEGINMYNILSPCAGGVSWSARDNLYRMSKGNFLIGLHFDSLVLPRRNW